MLIRKLSLRRKLPQYLYVYTSLKCKLKEKKILLTGFFIILNKYKDKTTERLNKSDHLKKDRYSKSNQTNEKTSIKTIYK